MEITIEFKYRHSSPIKFIVGAIICEGKTFPARLYMYAHPAYHPHIRSHRLDSVKKKKKKKGIGSAILVFYILFLVEIGIFHLILHYY